MLSLFGELHSEAIPAVPKHDFCHKPAVSSSQYLMAKSCPCQYSVSWYWEGLISWTAVVLNEPLYLSLVACIPLETFSWALICPSRLCSPLKPKCKDEWRHASLAVVMFFSRTSAMDQQNIFCWGAQKWWKSSTSCSQAVQECYSLSFFMYFYFAIPINDD